MDIITSTSIQRQLLSPPGDTIQETLDAISMDRHEFAERMGKNMKYIHRIIKGREPISENTAAQLELVLGIPAKFWLERENEYRRELVEIASAFKK